MFDFFDEFSVFNVSKPTAINKLLQVGVKVYRVKSLENGIKFCVRVRDGQKVIEIFDALCYNYKTVKGIDKKSVVGFLKKRWAIIAFFFVFVAMLALMPRYVFTVSVDAPSYLYDEVREVLDKNGAKKWQKVSNVDTAALENEISRIDGVSFVDARISGSTLYVGVRPSLKKTEIVDVSSDEPVICSVDAVLTRQIVFSGTPAFKTGDTVKVGDALILPKIVSGEEEIPARASGEVYGIIGYSATIAYGGVSKTYEKSGNRKTFRTIEFLGLSGKTPESPYKLFETSKRKVSCGFLIPLDFFEITFDEIVEKTISLPYEQVEADVRKRAEDGALNAVPKNARIIRREINVTEAGGIHYVTATVFAEGRIDASR